MEAGGSRSRYFLIGRGVPGMGWGSIFNQKYRCTREVRRPREVDSSGIFSFFFKGAHSPQSRDRDILFNQKSDVLGRFSGALGRVEERSGWNFNLVPKL